MFKGFSIKNEKLANDFVLYCKQYGLSASAVVESLMYLYVTNTNNMQNKSMSFSVRKGVSDYGK